MHGSDFSGTFTVTWNEFFMCVQTAEMSVIMGHDFTLRIQPEVVSGCAKTLTTFGKSRFQQQQKCLAKLLLHVH